MLKNQERGELDEMIFQLLKRDAPLILDYVVEKNYQYFIVPSLCCEEDHELDAVPFKGEWVEYAVSDGLPGDRTYSEDYYTYADAQEALKLLEQHEKEEALQRQKQAGRR